MGINEMSEWGKIKGSDKPFPDLNTTTMTHEESELINERMQKEAEGRDRLGLPNIGFGQSNNNA